MHEALILHVYQNVSKNFAAINGRNENKHKPIHSLERQII